LEKIFGKPKLKKDGTPGKTFILPPVDEKSKRTPSRA
jgi:DNA polymerase-1